MILFVLNFYQVDGGHHHEPTSEIGSRKIAFEKAAPGSASKKCIIMCQLFLVVNYNL